MCICHGCDPCESLITVHMRRAETEGLWGAVTPAPEGRSPVGGALLPAPKSRSLSSPHPVTDMLRLRRGSARGGCQMRDSRTQRRSAVSRGLPQQPHGVCPGTQARPPAWALARSSVTWGAWSGPGSWVLGFGIGGCLHFKRAFPEFL